MTNYQLLRKLEKAYMCCNDCGLKYGTPSTGCSSMWHGRCEICSEDTVVTEVRDYGYLRKGIHNIRIKLQK